ncbi:hypothetical protein AB8951_19360, partial [Yersinia enterocolitica]|uniref:hypothetical protein n=1 Tax=Yersinia enterocolitica TaxID=630 RepID=UPI003D05813E
SAILWKPPAHSPEENMVRQKCSGIRRSYLAGYVNADTSMTVNNNMILKVIFNFVALFYRF